MNARFPSPLRCWCVDHEIAILRLVDAPPEDVFAAWIEPRHLRRWWGSPEGSVDWEMSSAETDPRRSGAWRVAIRGPQGKMRGAGGVYRELDPPRGLAFTHAWEEEGRLVDPRLVLVDFAPTDGQTRLSFSISGYPSAATRDSEIEPWHQCLDRLVRYFSEDSSTGLAGRTG